MTLADLQSNISISANNAVTGDIEWCSGYTQFSTDIGEQAGWYLALQVTPDVEDATVTAAYNGTIRELDNNIYIIRLADGENTITFTAEKEGYTTGRLTLDLSGLNKEAITNYCYVTSLTNGVTVTPLQFGESKQLSGIVPYDTTTSSNHFRLKYRTFIPIPAGSQISVSHFGTELGASTFNTVTPQEGEPYSEAEVEITITQEILDSQSPSLSTLIAPDTGEVLDRFYCSLGVDDITLEAAPYNPETDPFFELTGVTYNDHTYSVSDFVSGGTLTRGYNRSQNNLVLTGATIKYCKLDATAEQNYYLAFTSRVGAEAEHQGSYYEFADLSLSGPINNPPSPHTLPQTFLVKVNKNTGNISGTGRIEVSPGSYQTKSPKIYFQNCTWETDPRPQFTASLKKPPSDATYNGNPITDYWKPASASETNWTIQYKYNNGYYGFVWLVLSESGVSDNIASYVDYVDVTSDMSFTGLGANDRVYMYDITSLKVSNDGNLPITFTKPDYLNAYASWLSEKSQSLPAYANGLTPRNMTISPLSSTVKAAGFSDYCNVTFTPIDPATATVVNNEVTVSVSGYLTSHSNSSTLGSDLTSYQPMYKNWPNSYGSTDKRNDIFFDIGKYFLVFEISNAFITIDNFAHWKCKGFTSSQSSFANMEVPQYMNSTSKSTIWAIPIESGMTSVSIQCIPSSNSTAFTPVTYTFDLTNVTYGTWPTYTVTGSVLSLSPNDEFQYSSSSSDTYKAGGVMKTATLNSGSGTSGTASSPYTLNTTVVPMPNGQYGCGVKYVAGGLTIVNFDTGSSPGQVYIGGANSDTINFILDSNQTLPATAKIYFASGGGTKHINCFLNAPT